MERTLKDDGTLVTSLIAIQGQLKPVMMTKENEFIHYKYLDLSEILKIAKPILTGADVLLQQFVDLADNTATVTTMLLNSKGESMSCTGTMGATSLKGSNATQMIGASITYLRRFQAMTILGLIGSKEDDESDFTPRKNGAPKYTGAPGYRDTPKPTIPPAEQVAPKPLAEALATNGGPDEILKKIEDLSLADVFSPNDRIAIQKCYRNAAGIDALNKVLENVQETYDERKGKSE